MTTTPGGDPAQPAGSPAVAGEDGRPRCPWALSHPALTEYHDREWGVVVRGEQALFERVTLEAFQSGLSWLTILLRRPGFRSAFDGFDVDLVAGYDEARVAHLLTDSGIIRNRAKVRATVANARAVVALRHHGGLDALVWAHRPDASPAPRTTVEVPTRSGESAALAAALKGEGLSFVGPTTAHALMEATGLLDTHLAGCFRRGISGRDDA